MPRITHETTHCVRCGKRAVKWCGWVETVAKGHALAGWCSDRCVKAWWSCHGKWNPQQGLRRIEE